MKNVLLVVLAVIITIVLVREFFPRTIEKPSVPRIETAYDTVETLPEWYEDSVRSWKKRKHTTDTLELVISETIVDEESIPVDSGPAQRPNIWPLLSYRGSASFGDTAVVTTFSLRNGRMGISQVFIPGILTAIEIDSTASPKFSFAPFPEKGKPSLLNQLKMIGIGVGIGTIISAVR